jgi:hypothetical protein
VTRAHVPRQATFDAIIAKDLVGSQLPHDPDAWTGQGYWTERVDGRTRAAAVTGAAAACTADAAVDAAACAAVRDVAATCTSVLADTAACDAVAGSQLDTDAACTAEEKCTYAAADNTMLATAEACDAVAGCTYTAAVPSAHAAWNRYAECGKADLKDKVRRAPPAAKDLP